MPETFRNDDFLRVLKALEAWEGASRERSTPVLRQPPMADLARELDLEALLASGGLAERLEDFLETYLGACHRIQHPASMGHQVSCPEPAAVAAAFVDAFTNNPMAIYEMGPAAATVEFAVVNWMLGKAGWRPQPWPGQGDSRLEHGAGVLTHGGSLAQLTALAAARARACPQAWEEGVDPSLVVVAAADAHYSVGRACGILGLGRRRLLEPPVDAFGRIDPQGLDAMLARLRRSGRRVMAVVANAGCTAAGLYDDLRAIGEVCQSHGVWLHVDGAHGGAALVSPRLRHLLDGVELARSLIWDAHKMMRAPGLCAAVLLRDHEDLDQAFRQQASYLFHDKEQPGFDAISRTVECTKAGLGLKVFFALAAGGEQAMAAYVEGRWALAAEAARAIAESDDMELAVMPQANIVCFRPEGMEDDAVLALRNGLVASGAVYITTTAFAGRRWLRLTFMNPQTIMADVERMLDLVRDAAKNI